MRGVTTIIRTAWERGDERGVASTNSVIVVEKGLYIATLSY